MEFVQELGIFINFGLEELSSVRWFLSQPKYNATVASSL